MKGRSAFPPEGASDLPSRLASGFAQIATALKTEAWSGATARGLTATQGQVLSVLGARGAIRLTELAAHVGVSAPTASDSIKALVDKGLVERSRDPDDGRATRLQLTRKGRKLAVEASAWPEFLVDAIQALNAEEQQVMLTGLIKIIRTLQVEGKISAARICVTCRFFEAAHKGSDHYCHFVDAPLPAAALRLDCGDHVLADDIDVSWEAFKTSARR